MKASLVFSTLVLLVVVYRVSAQKTDQVMVDPKQLIKDATSAYQTGNLNRADSLFATAMTHDLNKESKTDIARYYAQTLIKLDQYDSAFSLYTYGLLADSTNDYLWYLRGELSGKFLRDAPKAIYDLSRAIELEPNRSIYYESRGLAYDAVKNYPAAEQDYAKMIEIFGSARNYTSRALYYLRREKYDNALADVEKAINKDELYTWSYVVKGEILLKKSNKEAACMAFRKANDMGNESQNLLDLLKQCSDKKTNKSN